MFSRERHNAEIKRNSSEGVRSVESFTLPVETARTSFSAPKASAGKKPEAGKPSSGKNTAEKKGSGKMPLVVYGAMAAAAALLAFSFVVPGLREFAWGWVTQKDAWMIWAPLLIPVASPFVLWGIDAIKDMFFRRKLKKQDEEHRARRRA